mgnify:CR=1 FL=1
MGEETVSVPRVELEQLQSWARMGKAALAELHLLRDTLRMERNRNTQRLSTCRKRLREAQDDVARLDFLAGLRNVEIYINDEGETYGLGGGDLGRSLRETIDEAEDVDKEKA